MRTSQKRLSENTPSCVLVGVYRAAHSPEQVNFFQSSNASRMHTCTLTLFLPVRCPYGWAYRQEERNTAPGHTGQSGSLPVASGLPSSLFAVYRAEHYRPLTPFLGSALCRQLRAFHRRKRAHTTPFRAVSAAPFFSASFFFCFLYRRYAVKFFLQTPPRQKQ